jgi:type I restriction enzyme, S subunit
MELKLGYKRTEVGVIPEDWRVSPLVDLGKFKNGINKSSEAFGHGFPFVNLMDVFGVSSIYSVAPLGLVDTTNAEQQAYDLRKGDVVFIRSSVKPSGVGLTALVETDLPKAVYSGFLIRFRDGGLLDHVFKRHCFNEEGFRKRIIAASSVSANTNVNQDSLRKLLLALPPTKEEQSAIAEALSDTDALIESLERLIAKKRHLKQGAMQELLTGQKRLPQFETKPGFKQTEVGTLPQDWQLDSIENLAHITTGGKNTQDRVDDGQYPFFVRSQIVERINSYSYDGEAVLTAGDGVGTGKVFHYINGRFDAHQRVYRISEFSERINGYFFFLYFSSHFYRRIMQMTAKSSVDSVRREMIAGMLVPLPPTKAEQEAVASILSHMDAEISALEAKLAKARQLKEGMMQELLTGRTRLK